MKCPHCQLRVKLKDKQRVYRCPSCGGELKSKGTLLKTEKEHKDWYNVPGKLGKQRKKPKYDIDG